MYSPSIKFLIAFILFTSTRVLAQNDSIVLKDIAWDKDYPAGMTELSIPSGTAQLAGFIYNANGPQKHPTLLLLHGYPGNERNLDLAQVVRAHGWNVIYFDYRGSWASQGKFSFKNCVEDVVNVVAFCKKYQDSLKIDTSNIVLFGHSMGGWVCLKALQQLPGIKKGFALSTWNIYNDYKKVLSEKELLSLASDPNTGGKYFVLNASLKEMLRHKTTTRRSPMRSSTGKCSFPLVVGLVWQKGLSEVTPGQQIIAIDSVSCEHVDFCDIITRQSLLAGKQTSMITIKDHRGNIRQVQIRKE